MIDACMHLCMHSCKELCTQESIHVFIPDITINLIFIIIRFNDLQSIVIPDVTIIFILNILYYYYYILLYFIIIFYYIIIRFNDLQSIIQDEDVDNEEFLRTPHSLLDRLSEIDAIDLTVCSKQGRCIYTCKFLVSTT